MKGERGNLFYFPLSHIDSAIKIISITYVHINVHKYMCRCGYTFGSDINNYNCVLETLQYFCSADLNFLET